MQTTILSPAIKFFNNLRFRHKITAIFSVLFLLLILPSVSLFKNYLQESHTHRQQLQALHYTIALHDLITDIQMHRGVLNAYLNGIEHFQKEILENENAIRIQKQKILQIDRENGFVLEKSPLYGEILRGLSQLAFYRSNTPEYSKQMFDAHTKLISDIILLIQQIDDTHAFNTSKDPGLNHLAKILSNNLLLLQELTGQLRGQATAILPKVQMNSEDRSRLLSLYTRINALTHDTINATIQQDIETHFPQIASKKRIMLERLNNLLSIVRNHLIVKRNTTFESGKFFDLATETIAMQSQLYDVVAAKYRNGLTKHTKALSRHILFVTGGFFLILLGALYLGAAFSRSVLSGIEKLRHASDMIARGNMDIHIVPDSNDEIAKALQAFNRMSERLDKNISFLNSYKFAIDKASIVSKTDTKGIITYVNDKFCEISGYSKEELIGRPHNIIRHPEVPKETFARMWKMIKSGRIWQGRIRNRTKNGEDYIVDVVILPIFDHQQNIVEYIGIRHDVTELEKSKEQIRKEMRKQKIDPVTGLPNRLALLEDLAHSRKPVLIYLNIDNFSALNDFYGTATGDRVLCFIAKLLQQKTAHRKSGLYKIDSDGFVIMAESHPYATDPSMLTQSLIDHIERETRECDASVCVTITLTGAITDYTTTDNYENLLAYLTTARKIARRERKKSVVFNHNLIDEEAYRNNIEWIHRIKEALREDRIVTYYQPIIDNRDGSVKKYETLVRLIERDGSVVSPWFFLDIAKKAKLYTRITKVVVDKAFAEFEAREEYEFSVNISFEDIVDPEISAHILEKLRNFSDPRRVILELTESENIEDYERVNSFIANAKRLGTKLAIDDFGSGYSNFDHLISLHADFIKIDGSLIKNIITSEESRIITEAIIAFSKKLGAQTVVEFVHNEAVYEKVVALGADYSQGFYLGEPVMQIDARHVATEEAALL